MKTRIYEIRDTSLLEAHPTRLIEAPTAAAAIRHVAAKYRASVPDTKRVVELLGRGANIEQAKPDQLTLGDQA